MREHQDRIGDNLSKVVSRRYADCLALRDMFVKDGKESRHAELVKEHTGIDVNNQVTGGAMMTFRTPGIPAICFPIGAGLTLVWASDDGVYQVLDKNNIEGEMLDDTVVEHRVQRFDAVGKPKKSKEYYRGILGAIYLKAIRDEEDMNTAGVKAKSFIDKLIEDILNPEKCEDIDPEWLSTFSLNKIAPEDFVKAIWVGYENHNALLREWGKICALLQPSVLRETSV